MRTNFLSFYSSTFASDPRPEASEVERNVAETERAELLLRFFAQARRRKKPPDILRQQLDPRERGILVHAHAQLAEALCHQELLRPIYTVEPVLRQRLAIGKPRREARKRRLIPGREPTLLRQCADVCFRHAGLMQRAYDAELPERPPSRPVIAIIIET